MMQDYNSLIERICRASSLVREDIERKIEAKRAKLSGLVSKEGAAQIVAAELGINFEKQKVKINEIFSGVKRVNTTGKIIRLFPVKEYKKENKEGKIGSFILADETGNIRTVMWDANHIQLLERGEIKEGDVVEISGASLRNSELHLTGFSDIKLSQSIIDNVKSEREFFDRKLKEAKVGDSLKTRAFIVHSFEPRFFDVCPECSGKLSKEGDIAKCEKHGPVTGVKRALLNLVIDDGTENIRAVLFSDQISQLGLNLEENFSLEREKFLGKEFWISGNLRENKFFNSQEFFVNGLEEVNLDELISSLEKK